MIRAILLLLLLAVPAAAQDHAAPKKIECYCTDKTGARKEMGEVICLQVDGRSYMARCEMVLNNPFWRKVQDGCLSSGLSLPVSRMPG